jgi:hypothetical protein
MDDTCKSEEMAMNYWWRRSTGPQQKRADPLMAHVMNLTGHSGTLTKDQLLRRLNPGISITKIVWDGCMATVRREIGRGVILRIEKKDNKYDGVIVRWTDGCEQWQPLDYIRIAGDNVEVWW